MAQDSEKHALDPDRGWAPIFRTDHAKSANDAIAALEECMPIYITLGRSTREVVKGMIIKPKDRAEAVSRLFSKVGGT
jgi:hypothetical protein